MKETAVDFRSGMADWRPVEEGADAFVWALVAQGVRYLFLNPGTDTFPVQEAIVRLQEQGHPVPEVVLCPFEGVALAAAHGYYAATLEPQAVLVHVDVGTQNLGCMLHNAQRAHIGVLVCAGRAPYTTDPEVRGTRDDYIHWLQEQLDQHGIVRNYVKWDYEVRRPDLLGEVVARAFQVAATQPPGPVYVTLPREVLMARPGQVAIFRRQRMPPARLGAGDPEALREMGRRLAKARRPVVLTGATGRTAEGLQALVRLAEALALPVVEWRDRVNFPADHPLHQGYDPRPWLAEADVVLVLDHDVPYIPTLAGPRPDAFIAQIDLDPVKGTIPLWTYPLDCAIQADTAQALPLLLSCAEEALTAADRRRIAERGEALAARHREQRQDWERQAQAKATARPIAPEWLAHCLGRLLAERAPDAVVVDETVTNARVLFRYVSTTRPGSWFKSGGSGLGWALGAALGVKLAQPERPVIAAVGDGSFVFGSPLAALWSAQKAGAPFLTVVFDNGGYNATKQPLVAAYPEGDSVRTGRYVGVELGPPLRYDLVAQSVGAYGERVEDPEEVMPALQRGLERVRCGQPAVIDVLLAPI